MDGLIPFMERIGRAIVRRPEVFLFDEPLSNLNTKLQGKMHIELAKSHKTLDTTMIYVRMIRFKQGHWEKE